MGVCRRAGGLQRQYTPFHRALRPLQHPALRDGDESDLPAQTGQPDRKNMECYSTKGGDLGDELRRDLLKLALDVEGKEPYSRPRYRSPNEPVLACIKNSDQCRACRYGNRYLYA